jgi:hypothetical protein
MGVWWEGKFAPQFGGKIQGGIERKQPACEMVVLGSL